MLVRRVPSLKLGSSFRATCSSQLFSKCTRIQSLSPVASTFQSTQLAHFSQSLSRFYSTARETSEIKYNDKDLRLMFDSSNFWSKYRSQSPANSQQTGLFDNPYLVSPEGILHFTQVSLQQSQTLASMIISDGREGVDGVRLIRTLDRLSDTLCQVIDLMGCLLASHPQPQYLEAARQAHSTMFEFMNVLNTSVELFNRLETVFADPDYATKLNEEEIAVGLLLLNDFKKSGIKLDGKSREKFVKLSSLISEKGHEFMIHASSPPTDPSQGFIAVPRNQLDGLDPSLANSLTKTVANNVKDASNVSGAAANVAANVAASAASLLFNNSSTVAKHTKLLIPTGGFEAAVAMRSIKSEQVRKSIWISGRQSPDSQQDSRLSEVLRARHSLAKLMGCDSYAEYELRDKMVKKPKLVSKFLNKLAASVYPKAMKELKELAQMKASATDIADRTDQLQAWDRDIFSSRYLQQQHYLSENQEEISLRSKVGSLPEYFSLGTVIQGLSRLFSAIYGIKFVPVAPKPGETWRSDVRRLNIVCEKEGLIGVMYCDLFQAPGKSPNPAHFTVRCSRKVFKEENDSVRKLDPLADIRYPKNQTDDVQQMPIIVLMCDFATSGLRSDKKNRFGIKNSNSDNSDKSVGYDDSTCLLTFNEVETLFHEMGHAMHSMLGRTALHNVSGTRCATDFVELPSVLMEHFASAPQVLALYAYHYMTGEPLPYALLQEYKRTSHELLSNSETYSQIKLAQLDQKYHSEEYEKIAKEEAQGEFDKSANTTPLSRAYYEVENDHGLFPASPESHWYTQFGHLVGYGASYYCYLFDRAIADRVWEHVFKKNPISREAGEKWRNEVLRWGGSRNPWELVANVLDAPEMANGDETAVQELAVSEEDGESVENGFSDVQDSLSNAEQHLNYPTSKQVFETTNNDHIREQSKL